MGNDELTLTERTSALIQLRNLFDNIVTKYLPSTERNQYLQNVANVIIAAGDYKFIDQRKEDLPEVNDLELDTYIFEDAEDDAVTLARLSPSEDPAVDMNSENVTINTDRQVNPDEFPGSHVSESRWWMPPFVPDHPASTQILPGNPPHTFGYIDNGDGTFQPFTREAALNLHFAHFPIQDTEAFLEAYKQKHQQNLVPFDHGDNTDDKVLVCTCLSYFDDGVYIQCDNTYRCLKQYYHPKCLGMPASLIPSPGDSWFCPDCVREGRGLASKISKMTSFYAKHTFNKIVTSDADRYIKPWTADALKQNPQTLRELGLSTLEEAKSTLLTRSTKKLGNPITDSNNSTPSGRRLPAPALLNGTVVRQPNKNSWSTEEDLLLVEVVRKLYNKGLAGQPLWDQVEIELRELGCKRVMGAARNRWMRGLREEYQLDERRKKNAGKLTTAIQVAKVQREEGQEKARYTVSRKARDPAGHVQQGTVLGRAGDAYADAGAGADMVRMPAPVKKEQSFTEARMEEDYDEEMDGDVDMEDVSHVSEEVSDDEDPDYADARKRRGSRRVLRRRL